MFKKRECKVQDHNNRRRRKREDISEDDEDNDDSGDLKEVLSTTKQRRTLIDQLHNRRGVDASELLKAYTLVLEEPSNDAVESLKKSAINPSAADALASKTQLPTGGSIVAEEQRIWDQKHAAAMEEYVQERLKVAENNSSISNIAASAAIDHSTSTSGGDAVRVLTSKDQLYRELAAQAAKLSGKTFSVGTETDMNKEKVHENDNAQDVLTAGAATAIAEVILPVSDRLEAVKATAQAAAMAVSISPLKIPNVRNKSAVPNRFRSSNNHHHPLVNQDGISNRQNNNTAVVSAIDEDRVGFTAARQLQQKSFQRPPYRSKNDGHQNTQSTDDRVYQQFIKRQREQQSR